MELTIGDPRLYEIANDILTCGLAGIALLSVLVVINFIHLLRAAK